MTSNPLRILHTLDRHLRNPFVLHIYGRSALALGYTDAPAETQATLDVDAILPVRDILKIEANDDCRRGPATVRAVGLRRSHCFLFVVIGYWLLVVGYPVPPSGSVVMGGFAGGYLLFGDQSLVIGG